MSLQSLSISAPDLRAALIDSLGQELGEYKRPVLPNTPAIWVGRHLPAGYKVVMSASTEPLINALEVVVDKYPEPELKFRNFGAPALSSRWNVFLVFHDDRQDPQPALAAICRDFRIDARVDHLPATDLNPEQYKFLIDYQQR